MGFILIQTSQRQYENTDKIYADTQYSHIESGIQIRQNIGPYTYIGDTERLLLGVLYVNSLSGETIDIIKPLTHDCIVYNFINIPDQKVTNLYVGKYDGRVYYKVFGNGGSRVFTPTGHKTTQLTAIKPNGNHLTEGLFPSGGFSWFEFVFESPIESRKDHPFTKVIAVKADTDSYEDDVPDTDVGDYTSLLNLEGSFIELNDEFLAMVGIK